MKKKQKKKVYLRCVFLLTVAFFYTSSCIHSLRESGKKIGKTTERCSSPAAFFFNLVYLLQSLQCTRIYTMYHSVCVCRERKQCVLDPEKNWGKWYFAANVQHLNCGGKRRADCIHFTRPIFDYIISLSYMYRMILSIHTSLCLLSKNIQLWTPDTTHCSLYRPLRVKKREKSIFCRSFFMNIEMCVFAMRFSLLWLFVVIRLFLWWRGSVLFLLWIFFLPFFLVAFFRFFRVYHLVCSLKPKIELSSRIEWAALDLWSIVFFDIENMLWVAFFRSLFHLTSNISLPPPLLEHSSCCCRCCCFSLFLRTFI